MLAQAHLVTKTDFDANLKKNNDRVTSNKSKLFLVETDNLKNNKKNDGAYFIGKYYFDDDGT